MRKASIFSSIPGRPLVKMMATFRRASFCLNHLQTYTPDMFGMRMSRRTWSGASATAASMASLPLEP
jgi:hypothetical protein